MSSLLGTDLLYWRRDNPTTITRQGRGFWYVEVPHPPSRQDYQRGRNSIMMGSSVATFTLRGAMRIARRWGGSSTPILIQY